MLTHTHTTHTKSNNTYRRWEETFGSDGYVYGTGYDDGFMNLCVFLSSSSCLH